MIVAGTHVPLSLWTVLALAVGGTACAATYRRVAAALGWRERPTGAALFLVVVALAITLTPDGGRAGTGVCYPPSWSDISGGGIRGWSGPAGLVLNVVLFLLPAFALVLASGRLRPGLVLAVVPPVVELLQSVIPGRICSATDVLTNVVGVVLGAVAARWWVSRVAGARGSPDR